MRELNRSQQIQAARFLYSFKRTTRDLRSDQFLAAVRLNKGGLLKALAALGWPENAMKPILRRLLKLGFIPVDGQDWVLQGMGDLTVKRHYSAGLNCLAKAISMLGFTQFGIAVRLLLGRYLRVTNQHGDADSIIAEARLHANALGIYRLPVALTSAELTAAKGDREAAEVSFQLLASASEALVAREANRRLVTLALESDQLTGARTHLLAAQQIDVLPPLLSDDTLDATYLSFARDRILLKMGSGEGLLEDELLPTVDDDADVSELLLIRSCYRRGKRLPQQALDDAEQGIAGMLRGDTLFQETTRERRTLLHVAAAAAAKDLGKTSAAAALIHAKKAERQAEDGAVGLSVLRLVNACAAEILARVGATAAAAIYVGRVRDLADAPDVLLTKESLWNDLVRS